MTLKEWEKLDKKFYDVLLTAYHHYIHSLQSENDKVLKDAHLSLLDKTMKEAYTLRQSYINDLPELK
jgi:hypothetical protein